MIRVLVPVRYPLSAHSRRTLERAIDECDARDGELVVLHVNVYQRDEHVSRADLQRAVEGAVGRLPQARFSVRQGFLVEETILEEIAAEEADVVVIGRKQAGRWRRALRRLMSDPDIERYLTERVDCELIVVEPP